MVVAASAVATLHPSVSGGGLASAGGAAVVAVADFVASMGSFLYPSTRADWGGKNYRIRPKNIIMSQKNCNNGRNRHCSCSYQPHIKNLTLAYCPVYEYLLLLRLLTDHS